jgi:predicted AAA+ superfamily ATPase
MDIRFQPNNTHLEDASNFAELDPHLRRLQQQHFIFRSALIDELPWQIPSILTLTGGRQIGKTTLLKQWMADLLKKGVTPEAISFFSGELIGDYQTLYTLIQAQLQTGPTTGLTYCIIDEITYVADWDKAVKYLADIGVLEDTVLVLSGSDSVIIQDARKRFPGRRGKASKVDFHYYPLSFRECLQLKGKLPNATLEEVAASPDTINSLFEELDHYLIHGGFLTAINDFESEKTIPQATLSTYSDWIRGDVIKRNKKEAHLKEIISAIIKHYTKQVSWDNLTKEMSIGHTQTISDYMSLLSSMDAVFIQPALREDILGAAPKKRKKLMFCDPFIYHAMHSWLTPTQNAFKTQIKPLFNDPVHYSNLVEACVATHYNRFYPTYYIKAEGEVDIAYVDGKHFHPIEVKWTSQLRPKDLKQIRKYSNGKIFAKTRQLSMLDHLPVIPLPLALMQLTNKKEG